MTAVGKLSIINKKTGVIVKLTHRQKITITVLGLYWIVLIIVTHIPIPQIVYRAHVSDKWLHFLAYINLVFLMWFSVRPDSKASWRSPIVWLIIFVSCAYGGIDEFVQPYFGRTKDLYDFIANTEGALAGFVIITFMMFWPSFLAVSAITIFGVTNLAKADLSKLVPIADAIFHIIAYGCFTLVWIRVMSIYPSRKTALARLFLILGVPIVFLLIVKAGSLLLGRPFATTDLLFAVLGIVAAVIAKYMIDMRQPGAKR